MHIRENVYFCIFDEPFPTMRSSISHRSPLTPGGHLHQVCFCVSVLLWSLTDRRSGSEPGSDSTAEVFTAIDIVLDTSSTYWSYS